MASIDATSMMLISKKKKILCFVDYYLPGYKGGGPIRTLANIVLELGKDFDFYIVTRNVDLSERMPYPEVTSDKWTVVGNANVFYASAKSLSTRGILNLLRNTPHDVLYLNSFFSLFMTILPLLYHRLHFFSCGKVVLAPRGELSASALKMKVIRKKIFIFISKIFGLHRSIIFQASSIFEMKDIEKQIKSPNLYKDIVIAPDLVPTSVILFDPHSQETNKNRTKGPLRIIFLSRITPIKNLHFLISILYRVKEEVELSIYGPIEDYHYWNQCEELIESLPQNISCSYGGEIRHSDVNSIFSKNDLFVFPTLGENFGHVVYEALSVGTAVLISNTTPWQADPNNSLMVLTLSDIECWIERISHIARFNEIEYAQLRTAALEYVERYKFEVNAVDLSRSLFSL